MLACSHDRLTLTFYAIAEDLPDDYFTPTIADLQVRQRQLHARAVSLNNAPLLTRAQREQQTKAKRDRWPNVRGLPSALCLAPLRFAPLPLWDGDSSLRVAF